MRSRTTLKKQRSASRPLPAMKPKRRSQLVESSQQMDLFQAWLLYIGASPKTGLPVSQTGMYTDFN